MKFKMTIHVLHFWKVAHDSRLDRGKRTNAEPANEKETMITVPSIVAQARIVGHPFPWHGDYIYIRRIAR